MTDTYEHSVGLDGRCEVCDGSDPAPMTYPDNPTPLPLDALGHQDEILAAFVAYDRLVRWEEHNSRLDATDPIVERAQARGHIVALVANLAVAALQERLEASERGRLMWGEMFNNSMFRQVALEEQLEAAERLNGELVDALRLALVDYDEHAWADTPSAVGRWQRLIDAFTGELERRTVAEAAVRHAEASEAAFKQLRERAERAESETAKFGSTCFIFECSNETAVWMTTEMAPGRALVYPLCEKDAALIHLTERRPTDA